MCLKECLCSLAVCVFVCLFVCLFVVNLCETPFLLMKFSANVFISFCVVSLLVLCIGFLFLILCLVCESVCVCVLVICFSSSFNI